MVPPARLATLNRNRLIMQNMLDKGHDQAAAETEIDQLGRLLQSLGRGRLTVQDVLPRRCDSTWA